MTTITFSSDLGPADSKSFRVHATEIVKSWEPSVSGHVDLIMNHHPERSLWRMQSTRGVVVVKAASHTPLNNTCGLWQEGQRAQYAGELQLGPNVRHISVEHHGFVSDWIAGTHKSRSVTCDFVSFGAQSDILSQLHNAPVPLNFIGGPNDGGIDFNWDDALNKSGYAFSGREQRRLHDLYRGLHRLREKLDGPQVLIHGDVKPDNFLWPNNPALKPLMIDFENMRLGQAAYDLSLLSFDCAIAPHQTPQALQSYQPNRPLQRPALEAQVYVYRACTALWRVGYGLSIHADKKTLGLRVMQLAKELDGLPVRLRAVDMPTPDLSMVPRRPFWELGLGLEPAPQQPGFDLLG